MLITIYVPGLFEGSPQDFANTFGGEPGGLSLEGMAKWVESVFEGASMTIVIRP